MFTHPAVRRPRLPWPSPASLRPAGFRAFHYTRARHAEKTISKQDKRPRSEEKTQTDFGKLNVFADVPPPASSIETCYPDGFQLANGVAVRDSGMLLVGGEVFHWLPWNTTRGNSDPASLMRRGGTCHIDAEAWTVFDLIWPKPGKTASLE